MCDGIRSHARRVHCVPNTRLITKARYDYTRRYLVCAHTQPRTFHIWVQGESRVPVSSERIAELGNRGQKSGIKGVVLGCLGHFLRFRNTSRIISEPHCVLNPFPTLLYSREANRIYALRDRSIVP